MCKNKVNEEKELKSAKISGGNLRPAHLALIREDAARSRMKLFDYLVNCAVYLHDHNVVINKEECYSDNDNRQTFIKRKVKEYVANRSNYLKLHTLRQQYYDELATANPNYLDPFHATCENGNIDELHYSIAECEAVLRDCDQSGEGLLLDIRNLISNKLTWPLEVAGEDTCFLLMCREGTISIPLKIVGEEIWMGSLPPKSIVYLNGHKRVI